MKPFTEIQSATVARRDAWAHIKSITDNPSLSMSEKLFKCDNAATIYCAMTGDDSMVRPELRAERQQMIDDLPLALERAKQRKKERVNGQVSIFDLIQ